jgi:hypothetical protein
MFHLVTGNSDRANSALRNALPTARDGMRRQAQQVGEVRRAVRPDAWHAACIFSAR